MHTLTLHLNTTKSDETELNRRFHAAAHLYNVMVKHANIQIVRIRHDHAYMMVLHDYLDLKKKKTLTDWEERRLEVVTNRLSELRREYGLTECAFQSYLKVSGKQFKKLLTSQQVQVIASRVWRGTASVLFGNGKKLHYKKFMDVDTIGSKSLSNGIDFDRDTMTISWLGLEISCKVPKKESDQVYLAHALDAKISYCTLKRMMFPNGWHYYVVITLQDNAPKKIESAGIGTMGIDPGVSTIAAVSDTRVVLSELAPKAKDYNLKIAKIQQALERSKRASNPDNFNSDGTVKKGIVNPKTGKREKLKWTFSKHYFALRRKLKSLFRQKSAYIKTSHLTLINSLLKNSKNFFIESMNWTALAKRAKKTERQEKESVVAKKDGTTRTVHKYKKKKRFGKSISDRSPGLFVTLLKQKASLYGGKVIEIDTSSFKASQYDHIANEFHKVPLSQRFKTVGEIEVQRDLYSAFLICHSQKNGKKPRRKECIDHFDSFVTLQNRTIQEMKNNGQSMKQCFGF